MSIGKGRLGGKKYFEALGQRAGYMSERFGSQHMVVEGWPIHAHEAFMRGFFGYVNRPRKRHGGRPNR